MFVSRFNDWSGITLQPKLNPLWLFRIPVIVTADSGRS